MKQEFLLHEKQVFQEVIIKTQGETKNETVKIHKLNSVSIKMIYDGDSSAAYWGKDGLLNKRHQNNGL